ncbi:MAG: COX15/CtaA family protein, partial [Bacteroidota bacterium]
MVVVGGITRLTHSGLSMVEWHLFMGSVPPLNETAWQEVFDKYQQFPEFQQLNDQFTLADFKSIFWWEYIHRLLGRMVGVVFLVPFLIFLVRKKLDRPMIVKLSIMFGMGAFQAFLGWFMVKSGLVKEPRVSHFRLAAHLITAFLTCTYIFWVALGEVYKLRPVRNDSSSLRKPAKVLFALLIIQIVWGAFVAGMRAGLVHNTFPMMDDQWVHEAAFAMAPWWENFLNGKSGVQLVHRL